MKKLIHESFYGEGNQNNRRSMFGVSEEVIWKLTDYYGGPEEDGKYIISDGDGSTHELCFANDGLTLFNQYITNADGCYDLIWRRFNSEKLYEDLTNDELIELCKSHDVWYDTTEDNHQYGEYFDIIIFGSGWGDHKKGYVPKYFLEKTLTGPIDSDLETMEEEIRE